MSQSKEPQPHHEPSPAKRAKGDLGGEAGAMMATLTSVSWHSQTQGAMTGTATTSPALQGGVSELITSGIGVQVTSISGASVNFSYSGGMTVQMVESVFRSGAQIYAR